MSSAAALSVRNLSVTVPGLSEPVVRDVSFDVSRNTAFGLIGESGSGKSLTCRAIVGLLPKGASARGEVLLDGVDLLLASDREMRAIRGSRVSMIFQDPMSALNPLTRVGALVRQVIQSHSDSNRSAASKQAIELLQQVGIKDPRRRARDFPHEFSGGMRQRVAIAMALAAEPSFLLADEPTSSLDVIVQAGILELLNGLKASGMGLVFVSHDFAVIAEACEFIGVMYAGQLIETGEARQVLGDPNHPYTIGLLQALPRHEGSQKMTPIPGRAPSAGDYGLGCSFSDRCPIATVECSQSPIELFEVGEGRTARCIHTDLTPDLIAEHRRVLDE